MPSQMVNYNDGYDDASLDEHSVGSQVETLSETPVTLARLGQDGITYPIGFIKVTFNSTNGHAVGGMLIADNTGVPLEFTVTSAVRPTKAQQILYGNRLWSYVAVNLCAKELIEATKNKPKVIFVSEDWMLAVHEFTDIPVLVLRKGDELGSVSSRPTITPPKQKPEYGEIIDLTSLDPDMLDAFDRIEKCREILATKNEEYKI